MDIVFDAASVNTVSANPPTLAHAVANLPNRYMHLGIVTRGDSAYGRPSVTGMAFNSVAAAYLGTRQFDSGGNLMDLYLYYLLGPSVGTYNITIAGSWPYGSSGKAIAASYSGIAQVAPTGTAGAVGTSTGPSVNVAAPRGGLVLDVVGAMSVGGGAILTVGANQTQRANEPAETGGGSQAIACSEEPGGGTITMSWTINVSVNWGIIATNVLPAAAGSQVIMVMAERWKHFLRDLKAGLVPPDQLRRTYRELVQI